MCYATSVGVKVNNLDRLKTDKHSKKLAFDVPAQLQLSVTGMETSAVSLRIKDQSLFRSLAESGRVENTFTVLEHLGTLRSSSSAAMRLTKVNLSRWKDGRESVWRGWHICFDSAKIRFFILFHARDGCLMHRRSR
jgi:hypothetical protein